MNYITINEKSEEGFQDLEFNIVDYKKDEFNSHVIRVLGIYEGEIVGFEVSR
jgi:hypothetical protein